MKCPVCGEEMEPGWLLSNGRLLWSRKARQWLLAKKLPDDRILLLPWLRIGRLPAFLCVRCRKLVVELEGSMAFRR